jgi:DNA-binding NarL/FixJ family response regulator
MATSILVVDDDPDFLSLATRVVEEAGLEVVATAHDVESAIAAASATRPEAALVDVGLPDREGIDLAHRLAALPWRPRVVLTSADSDAASAIDCDARGPLPFLPKQDLANSTLRRLLVPE